MPEYVELELVADGDGAHFVRHSDIPTGPGRRPLGGDAKGQQDRLLSGVYYFHREPKAFSGGALRLHRFGGVDVPEDWVDVEPEQNSFVAFPTWAPHEVRPISCPSRDFADSRLVVNAWLCAPSPEAERCVPVRKASAAAALAHSPHPLIGDGW